MATFAQIKERVLYMLGEVPEADDNGKIACDQYNAAQLQYAVHAGLDAILPWVYKALTVDIAANVYSIALPASFHKVVGVWDNEAKIFIEQAVIAANEPIANVTGNSWLLFPTGSLTIYDSMDEGGKLYYAAMWTKPTGESDVIEIPDYAITGLCLYTGSLLAISAASLASNLGQYKTKIDSGRPTDNPLIDLSNFMLKRFELEMSRMP